MKLKKHKHIIGNLAGYRLDKYVKHAMPTWTKVFILKMIRAKNITVNQKRTIHSYKLINGDEVNITAPISSQNKPVNLTRLPSLDIVVEDDNIIVVNKPIGVISQGSKHYDTMNNRLVNYVGIQENTWKPTFVHRLDRNTSGIMVGAKNYQTFNELSLLFKNRKVIKTYMALVQGKIPFKYKIHENYLIKKGNMVFVAQSSNIHAKFAKSIIKVVEHIGGNTLVEIELVTGRTHQIRVHMSELGYPVCGDTKYGNKKDIDKFKSMALIAQKLSIPDEFCIGNLSAFAGQIFEIKSMWFLNQN